MTYLASYPRSGSTLLRILLFRAFGLHTSSVYEGEHEAWERDGLADYIGSCQRSDFIKTHDRWMNQDRAIYVRRKVHEIIASFVVYRGGDESIGPQQLIESPLNPLNNFRSWLLCPELLIVSYSHMLSDPWACMYRVGEFIDRVPAMEFYPPAREDVNEKRDGFAAGDGAKWKQVLTEDQIRQCDEMERDMDELAEAESGFR